MIRHSKNEKGQMVVMLMVGFVVLIGFAALAIDGSMYFADRRYDQNTADSASLAAAAKAAQLLDQNDVISENFSCSVINANASLLDGIAAPAIEVAGLNDFTIARSDSMPDKNGVYIDCIEDVVGGYADFYLDIYVKLSSDTKASFSSGIFGGMLENQVTSVTRIRPKTSLGYGMAIVSMNEVCANDTDGLDISGDALIKIGNNGAHSNACLKINGDPMVNTDLPMTFVGTEDDLDILGHPTFNHMPVLTEKVMDTWELDPPVCSGPENAKVIVNVTNKTLSPGTYSGFAVNGSTLYLDPGLYCLTAVFKITGGDIKVNSLDPDEGVTLYFISDDYEVTGNATINLRAPSENGSISIANGAIPGILMFMPPSNVGVITISGDSSSTYDGTVYAPSASITIGGGSSTMTDVGTQVIGANVAIQGGSGMTIEFEGADVFHFNENIQLEE